MPPGMHPGTQAGPQQPTAFAAGKHLIIMRNGRLPYRCVKCNAQADAKPITKRYYWHHPAWYLLIFVALLIYAVVALCIRKDMKLIIPMCKQHRQKRMINTLIWVGALLLSLVLLIAAIAAESGPMLLACLFFFLGGLIYGIVVSQLLKPQFMDDYVGKFSGANRDYLQNRGHHRRQNPDPHLQHQWD